jgi:hypothetical protein
LQVSETARRGVDSETTETYRHDVTTYRGLRSSSALSAYGSEGLYVADHYAVSVDDPDCPVLVELEVAMIDGQPECVGLRCLPRPGATVASEMLRKVPLRRYLRESATAYSVRSTMQHGVEVISATGTGDEPLLTRAAEQRQRREITDEFLEQVAAVYMAAETKPRAAVMLQLHGSKASASRWISEARNRGLITESATEETR